MRRLGFVWELITHDLAAIGETKTLCSIFTNLKLKFIIIIQVPCIEHTGK